MSTPNRLDIESRGRARIRRGSLLNLTPNLVRLAGGVPLPSAWGVARNQRGRDSGASTSRSPPRAVRRTSRGRSMRRRTSRSRRRTRRRSSRRTRTSGIASRQRDVSTRYRARRSRGRRGGRRFGRRVIHSLLNMEPLQIYTIKTSLVGTSAVNAAGIFGVGLYTTQQTDQPDLYNIWVDAGLTLATTTNASSRLYFKSACLDVELKNTGSIEIVMDIYEIMCMHDVDVLDTIATQWATFYGKMKTITFAGSSDVAVSVFENPVFCEHYKVLSKQECLILPGEIITRQLRDGKDRLIEGQKVLDYPGSLPRVARFFLLSWHGAPDPTAGGGSTPAIAATTVAISYQKAYKYAFPPAPISYAQVHNA